MNVTSLTDKRGFMNNSCINFCSDDNYSIDDFLAASSRDRSNGLTPHPPTAAVDNSKMEPSSTATGATKQQETATIHNNDIADDMDDINGVLTSLGMVMWKDFDNSNDATVGDTRGNDEHVNKIRAERALAKEMATLSVEERNKIMEDIHGVRTEFVNEDPGYVDDCIKRLKQMLRDTCSIGGASGGDTKDQIEAYNKAMSSCPSYFDRKFYLMFLRCREFKICETAKLILSHFGFKSRLFGADKLARDIILDDLSEDDIAALHSGYHLFPSERDAVGRAVGTLSSKYATCKSWDNQLRANWYVHMDLIKNDECVQIKGIVRIMYEVGRTFSQIRNQASFKDRMDSIKMYQECLPVRIASFHFCHNEPKVHAGLSMFLGLATKETRIRFRVHYGGHVECQYALMSFGIPLSSLTVDLNGNFKHDLVDEYIERQRSIEKERRQQKQQPQVAATMITSDADESKPSSVAVVPVARIKATENDILLGRGIPYQRHPGNIRLSQLIEQRLDEFNNASTKFQKTVLTWDVLKTVQEQYGGRFLEKDGKTDDDGDFATMKWKLCSNDAARFKVAYGFRSLNKIHRRNGAGSTAGGKTKAPNNSGWQNDNNKRLRFS